MIATFNDFCCWMYVVVDDLWRAIAPCCHRSGPAPECSDSELITMALVGECCGWDQETELIAQWRQHRDLFPRQPERSRFNRRRRHLMGAMNALRRIARDLLDVASDRQCAIDCLPVPVVGFHLVPGASREWAVHGAQYGRVDSKKTTIYGYKLHLVVTLGGVILNYVLAPANACELEVMEEVLEPLSERVVLGDKAYISAPRAQELQQRQQITLLTVPRRNQRQQLPPPLRRLQNGWRAIIETVNGQLTEQFHLEQNHAHSFWGLCARLQTKLAAHTLCLYLNRLLGNANFLQIKALAFPSN
jgi:hypothetical protein